MNSQSIDSEQNILPLGNAWQNRGELSPEPLQIESWKNFIDSSAEVTSVRALLEKVFPITFARGSISITLIEHECVERASSPGACLEQGTTHFVDVKCQVRVSKADANNGMLDESETSIVLRLPQLTEQGTLIINGREFVYAIERRLAGGIIFYESETSEVSCIVEETLRGETLRGSVLNARVTPDYGEPFRLRCVANDLVEIELSLGAWIPVTVLFRALGARNERDLLYLFCVERPIGIQDLIARAKEAPSFEVLSRPLVLPPEFGGELERYGDYQPILLYEAGSIVSDTELASAISAGITEVNVYRWREKMSITGRDNDPGQLEVDNRRLATDVIDAESGAIIRSSGESLDPTHINLLQELKIKYVEVCSNYTSDLVSPLLTSWRRDGQQTRQQALRVVSKVLGIESYDDESVRLAIDKRLSSPQFELGYEARDRFDARLSRETNKEEGLNREDIVGIVARLLELSVRKDVLPDAGSLENFRFRSTADLVVESYRKAAERLVDQLRRRKKAALLAEPASSWGEAIGRLLSVEGLNAVEARCRLVTQGSADQLEAHTRVRGSDRDLYADKALRLLFSTPHPSWYSRLCLVDRRKSNDADIQQELAKYARLSASGMLLAPYRKVKSGRILDTVVWLNAAEEWGACVAPANPGQSWVNSGASHERILCRCRGELVLSSPEDVDFSDFSTDQSLSSICTQIPFLEHSPSEVVRKGAEALRYACPLLKGKSPLVKARVQADAFPSKRSNDDAGRRGTNLMAAYMVWDGMNAERQVVVSRSAIERGELVSVERHKIHVPIARAMQKALLSRPRDFGEGEGSLDRAGIIRLGAVVGPGDILIALSEPAQEDETPESRLTHAIFPNALVTRVDRSVRATARFEGIVDNLRVEAQNTKKLNQFMDQISRAVQTERAIAESRVLRNIVTLLPNAQIKSGIEPRHFSSIVPGQIEQRQLEKLQLSDFDLARLEVANPSQNASLRSAVDLFFRQCAECVETLNAWQKRLFIRSNVGPEGIRLSFSSAHRRPLEVGDIIRTRHGGGGVVGKILQSEDMPFLPDGRPIELLLNPLQVLGEQRVGELMEATAGFAADMLNVSLSASPFAAVSFEELKFLLRLGLICASTPPSRLSVSALRAALSVLRRTGKYKIGELTPYQRLPDVRRFLVELRSVLSLAKRQQARLAITSEDLTLCQKKSQQSEKEQAISFVAAKNESAEESFDSDVELLLSKLETDDTGKTILRDGRTGEYFGAPITIGLLYVSKMVTPDRLPQARSIGEYGLVTKQPLPPGEYRGGQAISEGMTLSLAANGAAYTLQEFQTVKSDDFACRSETYESILKGRPLPSPILSAATQNLLTELQGMGIQVILGYVVPKKI